MKSTVLAVFVFSLSLTLYASVSKAEPAYCDLKTFKSKEIKSAIDGLPRLHLYQIGQLTLAGLGVGDAKVELLEKFNTHYSNVGASEKYCTWYFNKGNSGAEKTFVHQYVSHPSKMSHVKEYQAKIAPLLDSGDINMVDCADRKRLVVMGCNGMRHRGPTAFGMFLAYSGCSAKSANAIVNAVWGLNGVPSDVREAIIQMAYERGLANAKQSQKLQGMLLAE